jgi:hypothetical protein
MPCRRKRVEADRRLHGRRTGSARRTQFGPQAARDITQQGEGKRAVAAVEGKERRQRPERERQKRIPPVARCRWESLDAGIDDRALPAQAGLARRQTGAREVVAREQGTVEWPKNIQNTRRAADTACAGGQSATPGLFPEFPQFLHMCNCACAVCRPQSCSTTWASQPSARP